jgi:ubiquinone/menaquinone biosynthesis C-methylase UbiE
MNHHDHVNLLRPGILRPGNAHPGGIWADFGSGRGAFTLALADLIGPEGLIYSVDKSHSALDQQQRVLHSRFPEVEAHYLKADFTRRLDLPPLDGLVVANALHFLRNKDKTVALLRDTLRPGGRFLVVEYNADRGNHWVPHPFSYATWQTIARRNGLQRTELMATTPSSFLGEFYAAVSYAPAAVGDK